MSCDLCHERPARETIKGKHVCRQCARTLKPERQARYLKRQAERTATKKAAAKKKERDAARQAPAVATDEAAIKVQ